MKQAIGARRAGVPFHANLVLSRFSYDRYRSFWLLRIRTYIQASSVLYLDSWISDRNRETGVDSVNPDGFGGMYICVRVRGGWLALSHEDVDGRMGLGELGGIVSLLLWDIEMEGECVDTLGFSGVHVTRGISALVMEILSILSYRVHSSFALGAC